MVAMAIVEPAEIPAAAKITEQALGGYSTRLAEAKAASQGEFPDLSRAVVARRPKGHVETGSAGTGQVLAELVVDMAENAPCREQAPLQGQPRRSVALGGQQVEICQMCHLPLGEFAYDIGGTLSKRALVHGECKAQHMLCGVRREEAERKQQEAELKQSRRAEYDIGWAPTAIPTNAAAAAKLGCAVVPQGMCCLVSQAEGESVSVAPTLEPASALNLEYLAVALQVRRSEGREPLFSLDPVDEGKFATGDPEASMQMKRFEPEWLAGTSVGEVMFQADYHLKELSFGEYDQPVVGMKSCQDYSHEEEDEEADEWSAREWFVVRKAEVHMSGDRVLIPYLRMGVEAREQVAGSDGLEDAPITRPDHPLVKYADSFTHNFDLIAERKSVVSQLREVAKASIMAKYLLESGVALEDSWFNFPSAVVPTCCLEVPQLWNDRISSKIRVKDGAIQEGKGTKMFGIYGGVDFGIDRFRLSAPSRVATSVVAGRAVLGRPASSLMATSRTGLTMGPARQFARLSAPLSATMSMAASRAGLGVPRVAAGLSMGAPQGVDLNLDQFNLSTPTEAAGIWGASVQATDAQLAIGSAFWAGLGKEGPDAMFGPEEKRLLKEVFNPHLSDRRQEGEQFTPPPTSSTHMQKLRSLVKAEKAVRQQRKEHFLSAEFVVDSAGPLFPASWTSAFEISSAEGASAQAKTLHPQPDYVFEAVALKAALMAAVPIFDRRAEDGTCFRIYRLGSLEVRTVQEHDGDEEIGMVFSKRSPQEVAAGALRRPSPTSEEKITKVTEYVECAEEAAAHSRSFVILETQGGSAVVTETWPGAAAWVENPKDLEDRLSLSKVIRSKRPLTSGATIGEMKSFSDQHRAESNVQYAQAAFCRALGIYRCSGFSPAALQRCRA